MFCGLVAPTAHAQMKWTDKGFANVNVGGQVGSHNLETNTTFDIYDETAQVKGLILRIENEQGVLHI